MDASRNLTVEDAPNGARGLKCAYVNSVIVPIIWILALSTLYIQIIKPTSTHSPSFRLSDDKGIFKSCNKGQDKVQSRLKYC